MRVLKAKSIELAMCNRLEGICMLQNIVRSQCNLGLVVHLTVTEKTEKVSL